LFYPTGQDRYSPTRYAGGSKTASTIQRERPTFFETTTIHPTILNDPPPISNDPHPMLNNSPPSKDSTLGNTSVNSSSSQQFSVTSSPSFHGKNVLARNEGLSQVAKSDLWTSLETYPFIIFFYPKSFSCFGKDQGESQEAKSIAF
jgi:hypothetical protein